MKLYKRAENKNLKKWAIKLEFPFYSINNEKYWDESKFYSLSETELLNIKKATEELIELSYKTCDYILKNNKLSDLKIPEEVHEIIYKTFYNSPQRFLGRFDFAVKGDIIKMYEFNADTPLTFFELGKIIPTWEKENFNTINKFNTIQKDLSDFFKKYKGKTFHFVCFTSNEEDNFSMKYLLGLALKEGVNAYLIDIREIYFDEDNLYDKKNRKIEILYKLVPWEWMLDSFKEVTHTILNLIKEEKIEVFENIWNMMLSNKSFLIYIKEAFPECKYLLNSSFDKNDFDNEKIIEKPLFEREGVGIKCVQEDGHMEETDTIKKIVPFKKSLVMYQEYFELPKFGDNYTLIGSWVVEDKFSGIIIREDKNIITGLDGRIIPYIIE